MIFYKKKTKKKKRKGFTEGVMWHTRWNVSNKPLDLLDTLIWGKRPHKNILRRGRGHQT